MPTTHEFDVLLFDNDGTITDSTPGVEATWKLFGNEYGFDGKEAAESTHGVRLIDSMRKWCKIEEDEALIAAVNRFEAAVIEFGPVALPGVLSLFEQLRTNAPADRIGWAVCTSATRWYASQVLERVGVGKPEVLVTSEDVKRGKPHPDPFLEGARRCQAPDNSRVLVFEDAVSGVAAGKAAGMKVLAVQTTTPREALQVLDPDFLVPDLSYVSAEWKEGKILITVRD